MYCSHCGKSLPEDSCFCRFCGQSVELTDCSLRAPGCHNSAPEPVPSAPDAASALPFSVQAPRPAVSENRPAGVIRGMSAQSWALIGSFLILVTLIVVFAVALAVRGTVEDAPLSGMETDAVSASYSVPESAAVSASVSQSQLSVFQQALQEAISQREGYAVSELDTNLGADDYALSIDTILLDPNGDLYFTCTGNLANVYGETVLAAVKVLNFDVYYYGNGGFRSIVVQFEDGGVFFIDGCKIYNEAEIEFIQVAAPEDEVVEIYTTCDENGNNIYLRRLDGSTAPISLPY